MTIRTGWKGRLGVEQKCVPLNEIPLALTPIIPLPLSSCLSPRISCSFGYITSTGISILAVVRDVLLREDKVRELFRGLHRVYTDAVCSPFAGGGGGGAGAGSAPGPGEEKLTSPSFEEAVTRLVDAANGQIEYRGPVPL